jgi:short-subunit dehydrogenase
VDLGKFPLDGKYGDVVKEVAETKGDIRILVNNAGMSHDMPVTFEDMSANEMEGIVGVNTCGVLRATKEALPYILSDRYLLWKLILIVGKRRD